MGYIYQADTYCNDCGGRIRSSLRGTHPALCPEDEMDHYSYDSDNYPKDADIEHEESDIPQHCAQCGDFLHNPLTSEGYKYVQDALNQIPAGTSIAKLINAGHEHLADWAGWYDFRYWDAEDCADGLDPNRKPGWYSSEVY